MMDIARTRARRRRFIEMRRHPVKYARLCLAVRSWALLIAALAPRNAELARILARTAPGPGRPYTGLSAETIWRCCRKAVRPPLLMADRPCLREGLLLNRFLVMAGYAPALHFGVDRTSLSEPKVRAHCWITLGARVFNPPEPTMIEIHEHRDVRNKFVPRASRAAEPYRER